MPVIRVGVQAPQGSEGQVVDLDGPRASIASIANVSAVSVAYSLDGGSTWTTLAAGASGGSGVIDAGMLRLRKVASTGAYPATVDVDATIYGLADASFTPAQTAAIQGVVSTPGNPAPYLMFVPGRQYPGSGNARDASGNDADLVLNAALADADVWANRGWITTAAGTNEKLQADKALIAFNLASQSILFSFRLKKAAPAGLEYLCGNGGGANQGFFIQALASGKVQVSLVTSVGAQGMGSASTAVFLDDTEHVLTLALDANSKRLTLWCDGVISDIVQAGFSGTTTVAQDFSFGAFNGSQSTTYAGQYSGIHMLRYEGGLPFNCNQLVQRMAEQPHQRLTSVDLATTMQRRIFMGVAGQSNELGSAPSKTLNLSYGSPLKDVSSGSAWPRLASMAGVRGTWLDVFNVARGGTSVADSWVGRIRNWSASMNVCRGSYVLSGGGIWRHNHTAGLTQVSTVAPTGTSDTTGADSVPWVYLGVPGVADVVGVLTDGHARFDPNGYVAALAAGMNNATGYDTKLVRIGFGQTDYAIQTGRTDFALGLRSLTDYCLARGWRVALGFTCYYGAAETYYQSNLLPGLADALAAYSGNSNVFAGANWRTALGVLATNPASGSGLQADAIHLNDVATTLAAAADRDALIAAGVI